VSTALANAVRAAAMASLICASNALAADSAVVIGNLDDLSGVYSADGGPGAVEGMRMAIADFGGGVLGREVRTLVADHQNKPDIGASKFREWADPKGLNMMLVGANTGVSIAMSKVAAARKIPLFIIGAVGAPGAEAFGPVTGRCPLAPR
jgi:branched-chain amino acid transport system substrate-binding protein